MYFLGIICDVVHSSYQVSALVTFISWEKFTVPVSALLSMLIFKILITRMLDLYNIFHMSNILLLCSFHHFVSMNFNLDILSSRSLVLSLSVSSMWVKTIY